MVLQEKKALKAIFRLLHQGRAMAFEGMPSEKIAWYFDELDYLMGLVVSWNDDRSQQFEDALESVCAKYNCTHIVAEFKRQYQHL